MESYDAFRLGIRYCLVVDLSLLGNGEDYLLLTISIVTKLLDNVNQLMANQHTIVYLQNQVLYYFITLDCQIKALSFKHIHYLDITVFSG